MITKLLQTTLPVVDEQKLIQTTDSLRNVTEEFVNVLKTDPHTAVTQLVHSAIEFGLKVVAAIIIYVIGLWLIKRVKKMMDYTEVGGAPLLGVQGAVVKAHGSSNPHAFSCAIGQLIKMIDGNVVEIIEKGVASLAPTENA